MRSLISRRQIRRVAVGGLKRLKNQRCDNGLLLVPPLLRQLVLPRYFWFGYVIHFSAETAAIDFLLLIVEEFPSPDLISHLDDLLLHAIFINLIMGSGTTRRVPKHDMRITPNTLYGLHVAGLCRSRGVVEAGGRGAPFRLLGYDYYGGLGTGGEGIFAGGSLFSVLEDFCFFVELNFFWLELDGRARL